MFFPTCPVGFDQCGKLMVDFVKCRVLVYVPLLVAGLTGWVGVAPCLAGYLKDLRIGQYDTFTRIVFEFDEAVGEPILNDHPSGQLDITFSRAHPDLIRRIPTRHRNRIDDIQIWMRGDDLVAFVDFAFHSFRYKWFSLSNPHRIVVDVSPLEPPSPPSGQPIIEDKKSQQLNTQMDRETNTGANIAPAPLKQLAVELNPTQAAPSESLAPESDPNANYQIKENIENLSIKSDFLPKENNALDKMQYYLVVALIAITILILTLLLLMLLLKNRWMEKGPQLLKADELIKRQDARIALLNECIQEQLKRYEMED